jgi:inosose dehydratase
MGTVVQSRDDIDALMQVTSDDVGLLLDTGHAMFAGADPVTLAETYADRIGHLHCKDIREPQMRHCINRDCSFLDAMLDGVFTVPGDGCIDYAGVFAALRKASYSGWAVVEAEQDPSVAPPYRYCSISCRSRTRYCSRRSRSRIPSERVELGVETRQGLPCCRGGRLKRLAFAYLTGEPLAELVNIEL